MLKEFVIVVLMVHILPASEAKLYRQCELANLLISYGFDKSYLANCK